MMAPGTARKLALRALHGDGATGDGDVHPLGTVIGALPMRLTSPSSPHVAEDFAARRPTALLTVGS
jgi:hypothetical protein